MSERYTLIDYENKSQFAPGLNLGTQAVEELIPLNRLMRGQSAEVSRIVGPAEDVHRLEEFGLCRGAKIQMFRPGNPCIVRMAGNKFCLRGDALVRVLVRRNGTSLQDRTKENAKFGTLTEATALLDAHAAGER